MFCILYKWFISRSMDTDEPLPRRVVRHIDRCPTCKIFHSRCLSVADQLSQQAPLQVRQVSPELHARILRSLQSQSQSNTVGPLAELNVRRLWPRLAPLLASAVVLLALVALHYYNAAQSSRPDPSHTAAQTQYNIADPIAWLLFPEGLGPESAPLIEEALQWPIQREIRLLREDGRAVADFFLACVPVELDTFTAKDTRLD